jgi:lysophospholipase L1-like esterase
MKKLRILRTVSIILIITFALTEIAVRAFLPEGSPIEQRFPVGISRYPHPYIMFKQREDFSIPGAGPVGKWTGYPGPAPTEEKPKDELRVFILGGSTVYEGNPTLSVLLEEEFQSHGFNSVKVFNTGVISSTSGMDVARLVYDVSQYKPDLVIMYGGGNDIITPLVNDPRPGFPHGFLLIEGNPLLRTLDTYPLIPLVAYSSRLLRALFPQYFLNNLTAMKGLRVAVKHRSKEWLEDIADHYVKNSIRGERISRGFGARYLSVFQPLLPYKTHLLPREQKFLRGRPEVPVSRSSRPLILKRMNEAIKSDGVHFADLSTVFDDVREDVFADMIHLRQPYFPVVAKALFGVTCPLLADRDPKGKCGSETALP